MTMWKKGDRVRMTAGFKSKMRGDCLPNKHVVPREGEPSLDPELPDDGCFRCSTAHVEEFGECIGVVDGLMDYNNCEPGDPAYDASKLGPEVDVRWQPSNLRYGYASEDLEPA